jgi:hypothetical protein
MLHPAWTAEKKRTGGIALRVRELVCSSAKVLALDGTIAAVHTDRLLWG